MVRDRAEILFLASFLTIMNFKGIFQLCSCFMTLVSKSLLFQWAMDCSYFGLSFNPKIQIPMMILFTVIMNMERSIVIDFITDGIKRIFGIKGR